jgi:polyisoprenoid-binding protein YceI
MRSVRALLFVPALASALSAPAQNRASYVVDAKQSKIEIHVYREGFLKAFGHDHQISVTEFSGKVQLSELDVSSSSVTFIVDAKSLVVVDPGESEKDRKEVQETMLGEKVLSAERFPQIRFVSSKVRSISQKGDATELRIEGTLFLHGTEKPLVLPIRLRVKEGQLTAEGEVSLLQTDYGITPIKVGGGAVRVEDKLKISFQMVSHKESGLD